MFEMKNFENIDLSFSELLLLFKTQFLDIKDIIFYLKGKKYILDSDEETLKFLYKMSMFENYDFEILVNSLTNKCILMVLNSYDKMDGFDFEYTLIDISNHIKNLNFLNKLPDSERFNKVLLKEKILIYLNKNKLNNDSFYKQIEINELLYNKFSLIAKGKYKNYFISGFLKDDLYIFELWKENSIINKMSFNFNSINSINNFIQVNNIKSYSLFDYEYLIDTERYVLEFKERFLENLIDNDIYFVE